ncbi:MAG: SpoIIE family protein phosphatase, partial [Candidatus Eisenbacteria bacterium]|nr:SpoIIE family protein phosphatase [Candidatus Latescibacterota bacterium]MBD3301805.1 SpoIIE family protein phosphatase [Candidatus Eisenbacteria bacterium]
YRGEEIALVATLMNQVGVAWKNNLLYRETLGKAVLEEELALARKIQQAFLPSRFPADLPFEVHGLNLPSKYVGGDYFDFFPLPDGTYALAIADVSGKGVPAALLASMLQASLRTLLREGVSPGRIFERVNRLVCESTAPDQFITALVGRLDPRRWTLTYCNAGHNYPFHHRSGREVSLLAVSDLLLGIDEGMTYQEHTLRLEAGDALLLYTDGVTEARDPGGDEFGEERLGSLLVGLAHRSAEEGIREIREEVLRFTASTDLYDDMTLLLLRVPSTLEKVPPREEALALSEVSGRL